MTITVVSGHGKDGQSDVPESLTLFPGEIIAIVGDTGSGKSRFLKDLEQMADGDSITGRRILLDGQSIPASRRQTLSAEIIAHLGQNMRFVLDTTVLEFIALHGHCRGKDVPAEMVLRLANRLTPEPIRLDQHLNLLSGGQARALMIADISLICDSPVVLIDEIENAGVDKIRAFEHLKSQDKLILIVTHDPHTALMADRRIVMCGGAVKAVVERSANELALHALLSDQYRRNQSYQRKLRKGMNLA